MFGMVFFGVGCLGVEADILTGKIKVFNLMKFNFHSSTQTNEVNEFCTPKLNNMIK